MKLYLIERTDDTDYDEYNSAVVVAGSREAAKKIHPDATFRFGENGVWIHKSGRQDTFPSWPPVGNITAKYIGIARKSLKAGEVICASFNGE